MPRSHRQTGRLSSRVDIFATELSQVREHGFIHFERGVNRRRETENLILRG
jgi:hypothetical protein